MIPSWAPNLHPLIIHFPIVLLMTALVADLLGLMLRRLSWLAPMAASLYTAGAIAAGLASWTGTQAAATVFVPGMAHPLVEDHRVWALATTAFAGAVALAQVAARLAGVARTRRGRLVLAAAGLIAAALVHQTAERGARLVYEQGVGVIAAPGSRWK